MVGVLGTILTERLSLLDALWFVIVSLTTTGYGDIVPVTPAGRFFVMLLLLSGVGFLLYAFGTGVALLVEGKLGEVMEWRGMKRRIGQLKNHIVVCGAGRVGQQVVRRLHQEGIPFVVVEKDAQAARRLREEGFLVVEGDATLEETLREAGVPSARGLVAALPSDADNVFIVLTGKELNPRLVIVARANKEGSEGKLRRAGADRVVAPEAIGGRRMAASILKPATVEFVDTVMHSHGAPIEIEEITVSPGSQLANKTLRQAQVKDQTGAMIIAIMRAGELIAPPGADELIRENDLLIAIGTQEQLGQLEKLAAKEE